jgi:arabinose-5-phosphate isomerase
MKDNGDSAMSEIIPLAIASITVQIDALQNMMGRLDKNFEEAIDIILASKGRVVVTGMGKSGIIGKKIAATLASTGTPSFFVHPGEAFHGDLGMIHADDAVLMISYSGETEEVIRLLSFMEYQGNQVIAMTGSVPSTLSRHAHAVLDISVEREACTNNLAPTSSITATVVMGDALAAVLTARRNFQPEDFARFHPGGSLGKRLLTRVCDVMHKDNLPFCQLDDQFMAVVHTITRGRLGLAIVMDGTRLVGLITDGDLRRAVENLDDFRSVSAKEIMTRNPHIAHPEERFGEAEDRMRGLKINSLVVLDPDGSVCGVLQIFDIHTAPAKIW